MYISKFRAFNYKSFLDSGEVTLSRGFNLVCGKNNVGKTALLEAIGLNFREHPHRSERVVPNVGTSSDPRSWVRLDLTVSGQELRGLLVQRDSQLQLPVPRLQEVQRRIAGWQHGVDGIAQSPEWAFSTPEAVLRIERSYEGGAERFDAPWWSIYETDPAQGTDALFRVTSDLQVAHNGLIGRNPQAHPSARAFHEQRSRTYLFRAERYNVGQYRFGPSTVLDPNARNLPEVLDNLQANRARFEQLCSLVRSVFPSVHAVSVRGVTAQEVEVLVWNHSPRTQRLDLAIPLNECGTGLGQVLAILYVVLTAERGQTILIDEPQSFLHPGAARVLVEILKDFPQHQFIIATHSPTIVSSAQPCGVTLVQSDGVESRLVSVDPTSARQVRVFLSEVGATLSDVFGAENILWVEGATEESCFPMIIERLLKRRLHGTAVKGVRDTGSFEGKHADLVVEIYRRLSGAASLLPPAVGFIFDSEGKSDQQKLEIVKRSDGRAKFIARRMFENYLLNEEAVAFVMNRREGFRAEPVTADEIRSYLEEARTGGKYLPNGGADGEAWITVADGARVLADAFARFSDSRCTYRKPTDAVALTDWIIDNASGEFDELAALLKQALVSAEA